MMRSMMMIIGVVCAATVLSEAMALGLLWYRGQLNATTAKEIRFILTGEDQLADADEDELEQAPPSNEDVRRERSLHVFGLDSRSEQLSILEEMVDQRAEQLQLERNAFEDQKRKFEERLKRLNDDISSEATEQARAVLQAMSTTDTVNHLMQLELDDCLKLIKGMPEKKIAKIMQEFFSEGGDGGGKASRIERANEILKSLADGDPANRILTDVQNQLSRTEPMTEEVSP